MLGIRAWEDKDLDVFSRLLCNDVSKHIVDRRELLSPSAAEDQNLLVTESHSESGTFKRTNMSC